VVTVPNRLKKRVRKAEKEQVLNRVFAVAAVFERGCKVWLPSSSV
jgi:hypothetical protein